MEFLLLQAKPGTYSPVPAGKPLQGVQPYFLARSAAAAPDRKLIR